MGKTEGSDAEERMDRHDHQFGYDVDTHGGKCPTCGRVMEIAPFLGEHERARYACPIHGAPLGGEIVGA